MKDYCKYVNVFQGCDEIDLPEAEGVAASWRFIKGLCGNNTPGAALPFGRLTACCYSGGYSSGYGRLMKNSHGKIGHLSEENLFKGIAHLQNDGTGDIDTFYNYAVVSPFTGDLKGASDARPFTHERAFPGYYACTDSLTGADCEVTVTRRAALHRISFPGDGGRISVDFSNDGLYDDGDHLRFKAGEAEVKIERPNTITAKVRLHNVDIFFCLKIEGMKGGLRLWKDGEETDETILSLPAGHTFGCVFDTRKDVSLTLGLSPKSMEIARRDALGNACGFDEAVARARDEWNNVLSRLDAEFDDERDYEIFYSNLYHSLLKPCDFEGESYLYEGGDFVTEFATIWDQYKTSLPLIYTLYPEMSKKIVGGILNYAEATGQMPHTFMLYNKDACTTQARMLAEHTLADAYLRGIPMDPQRALTLSYQDAFGENRFDEYAQNAATALHKAFVIDITDACAACALMAEEQGDSEKAARFRAVADCWSRVFDPGTGLLLDGERFYEGNKWNYSFRLLHDMEKRMDFAGGKEGFAALADRFFGFVNPGSEENSFEGFNNETDMESPYVYHFAERHDRLSEIIDGCLRFTFTTGRGGIPGNNDSGGLCACYIWNAVGLFPVSGQDLMIIGSPRARRCVFRLSSGKTLTVEKQGSGIYVEKAELNGKNLDTLCFTAREMMQGGTLKLIMSDTPVVRG